MALKSLGINSSDAVFWPSGITDLLRCGQDTLRDFGERDFKGGNDQYYRSRQSRSRSPRRHGETYSSVKPSDRYANVKEEDTSKPKFTPLASEKGKFFVVDVQACYMVLRQIAQKPPFFKMAEDLGLNCDGWCAGNDSRY